MASQMQIVLFHSQLIHSRPPSTYPVFQNAGYEWAEHPVCLSNILQGNRKWQFYGNSKTVQSWEDYGMGGIRNCKTFFIGQFGTFIFVACGREMRSLWYFIFYLSEISIFNFTEYFWDFTKFPPENRNRVKFPGMTRTKCLQLFSLLSSNSNVKFPHMNRNLFLRENEKYAMLCRVCVSDGKKWQGQHGTPNVVRGDDEVSTSDGERIQHDKNLLFQYSPPMATKLFMACSFFHSMLLLT